ncbi:ABC transporter ATP-binding protein [Balneolaceae bacterium YR4-1]|uniref:ABC transporter ATP-binding protein n=1 Tax=Halalkalibaculum roseum TaxID=2709311 RepID=A0A6M1SUR8_9BACT|nr:ABC transporter ATP-binding protein [Halalkalibaculum roseum]NGP76680.1 ABC transporter ATP-binding protein [Halalkalibaculum roseum]
MKVDILKRFKENVRYYYEYLGWRIFPLLGIGLFVGLLDGFGLAMFVPLLEMAADGEPSSGESMGNLKFIIDSIEFLGLGISLYSVLVTMIFFFVFKGIAVYVSNYLYAVYSELFIRSIRVQNIDALSNYSFTSFVKADAGNIQNSMSGEVQKVAKNFQMFVYMVRTGLILLTYIGLAFLANPQFSVLVIIGGLISHLIFYKLYKKTEQLGIDLVKSNHAFQGLLIQEVNFFKYLKATGLVKEFSKYLKNKVYDLEDQNRRVGILRAIMQGSREPIMILLVVMIILIQVEYLGGELGAIILALLFFYRGLSTLMSLLDSYNSYLSTIGSLQNMKTFTNELISNKENERTHVNTVENFEIEIQNLYFSYNGNQDYILKDINLSIEENETVAFVGESGAGKTTLVNVIAGLLKPSKGTVKIGSSGLDDIDMNQYRKSIGYITQEPVIFDDTVFNNVTFWGEKSEKNIARFNKALKKAGIFDFVQQLDHKEESRLGNNGISLSGGQRQRISIARELYKNVNILMMDEATSALDSETELVIQKNIEKLQGEHTILIIAHRLSTIKNADRVVIMEDGKIERVGTYDELVNNSVSFRRMVELQEV